MSTSKLFTVAGITTHSREDVTVTKVRYGNDMIRLVKTLSSDRKIGVSYDLGGRGDGFLDSKRVDLVDLPNAMTKEDALAFLAKHADFQSPADQAVIQDALTERTTKPAKQKEVKVELSLDAIKARGTSTQEATTEAQTA
jgi:hypothetical protein